jgi:hypothetical protein
MDELTAVRYRVFHRMARRAALPVPLDTQESIVPPAS